MTQENPRVRSQGARGGKEGDSLSQVPGVPVRSYNGYCMWCFAPIPRVYQYMDVTGRASTGSRAGHRSVQAMAVSSTKHYPSIDKLCDSAGAIASGRCRGRRNPDPCRVVVDAIVRRPLRPGERVCPVPGPPPLYHETDERGSSTRVRAVLSRLRHDHHTSTKKMLPTARGVHQR